MLAVIRFPGLLWERTSRMSRYSETLCPLVSLFPIGTRNFKLNGPSAHPKVSTPVCKWTVTICSAWQCAHIMNCGSQHRAQDRGPPAHPGEQNSCSVQLVLLNEGWVLLRGRLAQNRPPSPLQSLLVSSVPAVIWEVMVVSLRTRSPVLRCTQWVSGTGGAVLALYLSAARGMSGDRVQHP